MGLLDQVRVQSKRVSDRAKFVHIDTDRIPAYAASLPKDRLGSPDVDPGCHYLGHGCGTVAFFLTLNTVNFGSGYFPHLNKRTRDVRLLHGCIFAQRLFQRERSALRGRTGRNVPARLFPAVRSGSGEKTDSRDDAAFRRSTTRLGASTC